MCVSADASGMCKWTFSFVLWLIIVHKQSLCPHRHTVWLKNFSALVRRGVFEEDTLQGDGQYRTVYLCVQRVAFTQRQFMYLRVYITQCDLKRQGNEEKATPPQSFVLNHKQTIMQKTCNVTHYICFAPSIFLLESAPEERLNKNTIGFF